MYVCVIFFYIMLAVYWSRKESTNGFMGVGVEVEGIVVEGVVGTILLERVTFISPSPPLEGKKTEGGRGEVWWYHWRFLVVLKWTTLKGFFFFRGRCLYEKCCEKIHFNNYISSPVILFSKLQQALLSPHVLFISDIKKKRKNISSSRNKLA